MLNESPQDPQGWFFALYEDTFPPLYRHVCGLCHSYDLSLLQDVEDILQETYTLAWSQRNHLHSHANPHGWLYLTATHKFGDRLRKAGRAQKREVPLMDEVDSLPDDNPQAVLQEHMDWIVETVGQQDFDLLLLYYNKSVSNEALAKSLGLKPSALRSKVRRIIQPLKSKNFLVFLVLLCNISRP